MAPRKKIGLIFNQDEAWAGGFYYMLSTINALGYLPEDQKPEIIIFYRNWVNIERLNLLSYPYKKLLPLRKRTSIMDRAIRKLISTLFKSMNVAPQYDSNLVEFVFPFDQKALSFKYIRKIYWIPDFQFKHLPHFFSEEDLKSRDQGVSQIAKLPVKLVFSSNDAKSDFCKFYPNYKNEIEVVPFASILPPFEHLDINLLRAKYKIEQPYFISPNQFWVHKNHMVILQALVLLKKKGLDLHVVFTGREEDFRNPGYTEKLKQFVKDNTIEHMISFLGFIDRGDQLQLMKHAMAVIQPSLFEGWSTVVEDAKAMDQTIVLSNINVHREQCGERAVYFDPHDSSELANCLERTIIDKIAFQASNYQDDIVRFANKIINL